MLKVWLGLGTKMTWLGSRKDNCFSKVSILLRLGKHSLVQNEVRGTCHAYKKTFDCQLETGKKNLSSVLKSDVLLHNH